MYTLISEISFDSAHFLADYEGKCKNIHGHRWTIKIEIFSEKLHENGHLRSMITDFGDLKSELKKFADYFDHALIIEKGTLKNLTLQALYDENFKIIEIDFRPTAENLAKYSFEYFKNRGFCVKKAIVFETPNNCATYSEGI